MRGLPGPLVLKCAANGLGDTIQVANNLVVTEPDHAKPLLPQILFASQIGCRRRIMAVSVKLNDQLALSTEEVNDIRPDYMLPPELGPTDLLVS